MHKTRSGDYDASCGHYWERGQLLVSHGPLLRPKIFGSVLEMRFEILVFPQPGLKSRKRRDGRHALLALLALRCAGHGRRPGEGPATGIHSSPGVVGLEVKVPGGLAALSEASEEIPAEEWRSLNLFALSWGFNSWGFNFTCKIDFFGGKKNWGAKSWNRDSSHRVT